ncbi:MAG TPA: 2-oxo acid dehydrogenase subunit E2, partial [Planctomycetaceae bacterium]|nr:2-oxo acid dehydrogenase subunit E2 [Planctomycetaceae bacterium]
SPTAVAARPRPAAPTGSPDLRVRAAPSVRRMARSLGIDLTSIAGSGPGGRITIEDVARAARREAPTRPAPTPPPLQFDLGRAGTTIPLAGLRRKVAEQMVRSARSIPHYSYIDACDVTALVRLRDDLVGPLQAEGIKLTYLAFWVQAVVRALRKVPIVNATFSEEDRTITLHDRYDIGIATATEKGLVVPVVRNADRLSLAETARAIDQLVQAVRTMQAKPDQLRGSTFTITSVGNFGGLASTPIINHPEVAIMGVGKIRRVPRYDEQGELRPVDEVYLSFSFDHRIVDGAVGALFANEVIELLRHPGRLLV